MTENIEYRAEFNIEDFVDKYVERVNREIDQRVLDKVEHRLAEYGYVKVVRCRDCEHLEVFHPFDVYRLKPSEHAEYYCTSSQFSNWDFPIEVEPDGFCRWAERKEVDE